MKRFFRFLFSFFILFGLLFHLGGERHSLLPHLRGDVGLALASEEFTTTYDVRYQVQPTGVTRVIQSVSLTNKLSNVYATRYSLTLKIGKIENINASDSLGPLKIETEKLDNQTKIELFFNEKVVGKDETLTFNLSYDAYKLANKTGHVWEVSVPRLTDPDKIDHYSFTLSVPQSFGEPAYISPVPINKSQESNYFLYRFSKNQLAGSGVSAAFGQFQIFDFVLSYQLKNPYVTSAITQIALPPDTAWQRVYYQKIDPSPINVEIDPDGNWLAIYQLRGKEQLSISAVGKVKIFTQSPQEYQIPTRETLAKNLTPAPYWPVDDPIIQEKIKDLKTVKEVYDFVIKTLDYDYSRVKEGVERLGAVEALNKPKEAICMEFTDLFVTLTRAIGVPAREINGFAYTTNPQLRPLSLVADVLHSWPEYWDEDRQVWVPVDPTWEETSRGVDFFHKFDLNHFAFAIHGQDSESPYPAGSYKADDKFTKDVQVIFGQYETETKPQIKIELDVPEKIFFEIGGSGKITIKNKGQSAVYNLGVNIENLNFNVEPYTNLIISVLPPFSQKEIPLQFSSQPFHLGQGNLIVSVNKQTVSRQIKLRSLIIQEILPLLGIISFLTFILFRVKNKRKYEDKKTSSIICL